MIIVYVQLGIGRFEMAQREKRSGILSDIYERITTNPQQCGGRPYIRGMRICISDILDLFAAGLSSRDILAELPDLEEDDIRAALSYSGTLRSTSAGSLAHVW